MASKRLIVAFTIAAALATFLLPDDEETIHRSLASQSNSVVRDPRTVQRKMNQILTSQASNPASESQGHRMQTANTVKANATLEMKPASPQVINQIKANVPREMKPVSPQVINKVNANPPREMKPVSPQVINKVKANASLETKPISPQATNKAKLDAALETKPISPRQQVGNLRQVPVESRRVSGTLSVMSRASSGRAMTIDEADAVGGGDTEVSLDRAAVEQTASGQPLVPTTTGESKALEKPLAKQDEDDEPEQKEVVPTNQDKSDDENDNAQALQKLLQESGPLPGQEKVDELLKAHRGNRDVDDVSNKDVEKERVFRLMYGRSKPNKTGEY
ncbi:hypothetical protein MHU86_24905 [Fragilaria crotonensis]|nr:hypothetical protein MHU86_24905 [Fragilaria crotonensis]